MKKNYILNFILALLITLSFTWDAYNDFNFIKFFLVLILVVMIVNLVMPWLTKINISSDQKKAKWWEYLVFGLIIIIPLIILLIAYYPGYVKFDSLNQWRQVQTLIYSNWHPVIQTLVFFHLPSLFYNDLISCSIFQALFVFLIMFYFAHFLRKNYLNFPVTCVVLLLMVLNPLFLNYSLLLLKDVSYSWCVFLGTILLINIVNTDGEFLAKKRNKLLFILMSIGVTFFRHNGIVAFLFMIIVLVIFYPRRRWFLSILGTLIFIVYLALPKIYANLDIKPAGGKAEMVGTIMSQISYYYNNGAHFTAKELQILNEIVPLEQLKEKYDPKNFNPTKGAAGENWLKVNTYFDELLKMYFKNMIHHPAMFITSFLNISSTIWETTSKYQEVNYGPLSLYKYNYEKNTFTERVNLTNSVYPVLTRYNNIVVSTPLRYLFWGIGDGLLVIIGSIFILLEKGNRQFLRYIPYTLIITNTLVIMLLITGGESRFVYAQSICAMPLLIYSLALRPKK